MNGNYTGFQLRVVFVGIHLEEIVDLNVPTRKRLSRTLQRKEFESKSRFVNLWFARPSCGYIQEMPRKLVSILMLGRPIERKPRESLYVLSQNR